MDPEVLAVVVLVINILLGIVFCFFGNRWLKLIVGLYGFVAGFMLANTLVPMFTTLSDMLVLFAGIGAGIVMALLFILFLYLGIFFIGFGGGFALCLLLADVLQLSLFEWYVYVPVLIICCLLGSLTLNRRRIFVTIFTAFIGASALAQVVYQLTEGVTLHSLALYDRDTTLNVYASDAYLIALAVLFVAGLVVQFVLTGKKSKR